MRDYIDIGPCEVDEEAVQTTEPDYYTKAHEQCRKYIGQLREKFGQEPDGARLSIKGHPHDFGSYYEVVCYYETDEGFDYAMKCERG